MTNSMSILLRHNYIEIPQGDMTVEVASKEDIATVLVNLAYYGYALNTVAYQTLTTLSHKMLAFWWNDVETNLKAITGDDRNIDAFVVYKNFPAEVIEKTQAEYWTAQILMYWGFPNEFFTQEVQPREKMTETRKAIVLKKSKRDTLHEIFGSYLNAPARWKDHELADVMFLAGNIPFSVEKIAFKENLVKLASAAIDSGKCVNITSATDVLRLAVGLSNGDVSLREKTKFISFKKLVRRYLLILLEGCTNLAEDAARRPELWKKFLHQLHPGDYASRYPNVCKVTDDLYNDRLVTFNSQVESGLQSKDSQVLRLLASRPGEFRRRLAHTLEIFGDKAAEAFVAKAVLSKLTTAQVVGLRAYLSSVNSRLHRVFPPKGNWNRLQLADAKWIEERHITSITSALGDVLKERLPKVKALDDRTKMIKLPNNGETSQFTRGTAFPIPDDVKFIRTASYWKIKRDGNVWFDNGWNFFNKDWKNLGSCCWDATNFGKGAVFSGDPTNSKEMEGKAAQLIDLYPDELVKFNVRYAVWNVLCFSNIAFSDADDVFAALQWGADPQKGKLFEPSRCQLSFPLTSKQMTKYICLLDLQERKMIYLDANLHGNVRSANSNGASLEKNMPPFVEYLDSLPSVHDLFSESVDKKEGIHVLYSDKDVELKNDHAYVFKPENQTNKYTSVNLNQLLS